MSHTTTRRVKYKDVNCPPTFDYQLGLILSKHLNCFPESASEQVYAFYPIMSVTLKSFFNYINKYSLLKNNSRDSFYLSAYEKTFEMLTNINSKKHVFESHKRYINRHLLRMCTKYMFNYIKFFSQFRFFLYEISGSSIFPKDIIHEIISLLKY